MYIREIRIERFRHLADVTIQPPKGGTRSSAIVLAGPNGGGKTSILEVIALGLASTFSLPYNSARQLQDYAFEVDFGFTEEEAKLIQDTANRSPQSYVKGEVERFAADRQYTRYFNRQPADTDSLYRHDRAHNLVQNTLRGAYGRPVGFSLRADRSYPSVGFQQQMLLNPRQDTNTRNLNSAYQLPELQYRDMLDFLIEGQYHHLINVGRHVESGGTADARPDSPIKAYNELFESLMPGYRITNHSSENTPSNLYIEIPSGQVIPFSDLSSGEREVFFVLANFIRQNVSNAVITVDEPELHLHPELSRRLVRAMLDIKLGNQIWLATHNGEVFDARSTCPGTQSLVPLFVARLSQATLKICCASCSATPAISESQSHCSSWRAKRQA